MSDRNAFPTCEDGANTSKRQRIDNADPTNTSPPHVVLGPTSSCVFPAEVLAHILDYMLYGDVRKCLLAGRIMAFDAARKVSALNTTHAHQLNVPASRNRFPNVEEINVFSLEREREDTNEDGEARYNFNVQTAAAVVFFLQSFPCLKRAWIGGAASDDGPFVQSPAHCYSVGSNYIEEHHREVMRGLVLSLCGAFRSGVLSRDLELSGIMSVRGEAWFTYACNDIDEPDCLEKCMLCKQVCSTFPFKNIGDNLLPSHNHYCFSKSREKAADFIASRPGGLQYLASEEFLKRICTSGSLLPGYSVGSFSSYFLLDQLREKRFTTQNFRLPAETLDFIKHLATRYGVHWALPKNTFTSVLAKLSFSMKDFLRAMSSASFWIRRRIMFSHRAA